MNIQITTPQGEVKDIAINQMPALDGWDIQARFLEFAASSDNQFRRAYTMEVLKYASVVNGERMLPILTAEIVENHLCSWQNVEKVFEEVLMQNGIDPKTHADKPHFWANAGVEMATSFIAEVAVLLGPAFEKFAGKEA